MTTLFISDLHLNAESPAIGNQFLAFLEGEARKADALYILGDLFESWVGDDDPDSYYASIKQALRAFTATGIPTYVMHGNRDFMLGERFAAETGVTMLDDPVVHEIAGSPVILSHGDALCTDDVAYQALRSMTRDPDWQAMMLEKTLEERLAFAADARRQSRAYAMQVTEDIADVNQAAVENLMRQLDTFTLLHGHTHRPAVHDFCVDGHDAKRIVLGDWYEQGSVVRWSNSGLELSPLPRA